MKIEIDTNVLHDEVKAKLDFVCKEFVTACDRNWRSFIDEARQTMYAEIEMANVIAKIWYMEFYYEDRQIKERFIG